MRFLFRYMKLERLYAGWIMEYVFAADIHPLNGCIINIHTHTHIHINNIHILLFRINTYVGIRALAKLKDYGVQCVVYVYSLFQKFPFNVQKDIYLKKKMNDFTGRKFNILP